MNRNKIRAMTHAIVHTHMEDYEDRIRQLERRASYTVPKPVDVAVERRGRVSWVDLTATPGPIATSSARDDAFPSLARITMQPISIPPIQIPDLILCGLRVTPQVVFEGGIQMKKFPHP